MNLLEILFIIGFCGLMILITYTSLVTSSRADDLAEYEASDSEVDANDIYKEQLKRIKRYIEKKLLRNWEVDMGMSSDRSDRLFTETVIELQKIESMIDEVMTDEDYE